MWKESAPMCLVAVLAAHSLAFSLHDNDQLEKDETIEGVNNLQTTWKAGRNFHPSLTREYTKVLFGLRRDSNRIRLPELVDFEGDIDIPESFDARDEWRDCVGLQTIRDQGGCGSCWAVSSASAFTDRLCIASNGRFNAQLSALQLLSCLPCGCQGGYLNKAFKYFENYGLCTGGDYGSHEGCQPYPFRKCYHNGTQKHEYKKCHGHKTPKCRHTCTNKDYTNHGFKNDLHFIKTSTSFSVSRDVQRIQKEIYKNGPLVASFEVHSDLLSYQSGVYKLTKHGKLLGGHAVKVIGWGVDNDTDYWLVANSWNSYWGDKGFFKMRRGSNECGFEEEMVGGTPDLRRTHRGV